MGKAARHFALGVMLVLLSGCRAQPPDVADQGDDAHRTAELQSVEPAATDTIDELLLPPSEAGPTAPEASSATTAFFGGSSVVWTLVEPSASVPADWAPLTLGTSGLASPAFDPLDLGLFGPEDVSALLSLYVDSLALDLIDPLAPSDHLDLITPINNVTYLEQVCRDTGRPDHVCRRLYGY